MILAIVIDLSTLIPPCRCKCPDLGKCLKIPSDYFDL